MSHRPPLPAFFALLALLLSASRASAQSQATDRLSAVAYQAAPSVTRPSSPTEAAAVLGTGFSYQGQLKNAGGPVNNSCDFQFSLWDAAGSGSPPTGGTQVGAPQTLTGIPVANGQFTVQLNAGNEFGASAFNGQARWLQTAVQCTGDGGLTTLSPRQPVTAEPYALFAADVAPYANVVVVAQSGGDYTSIQAALNSITTASAGNRFLVWVGPGTYTEQVTMKPYVDIEGAGELTTKITNTGSASGNTGTVVGASNAELRFLTVENTGGNTYAIAVYNSTASPRLTHVTATASGGTAANHGVHNQNASAPTMTEVTATASGGGSQNTGVGNYYGSSPTMTEVTATASGGTTANYGVHNYDGSSPTMTEVRATASGGSGSNFGVYNWYSRPAIQNSTIGASGGPSSYGIYNYATSGVYVLKVNNSQVTGSTATIQNDTGFFTLVGATLLEGGAVAGGGTVTCAGVYDENYMFFASTCP